MQKLTNKEFQHRVNLLTHGEYEFLEPYQGRYTKIACVHKPCGYTFRITPSNFYKEKHVCPICKYLPKTYHMYNGHFDPWVRVRCSKGHRFHILESQLPDFVVGKIQCPICKKLAYLDPLYKHAQVVFTFEFDGGKLL